VAVAYTYPWSELITGYKFRDKPGWAPFFADLLLANGAVRQAMADLGRTDLVISIPLSDERLQKRGFNQAWELAASLLRKSGGLAQADARLMLRVRHTRPQTELRRDARQANVRGAFQLDPLRAGMVAGRRVILVDDVMTSGASLFTAADVLRKAGAAHITALAIARTPAT
jgi:ComF family protein